MYTAGKVLVVLILLFSLIWVVLTAGVTQMNRNGNQALINLTNKLADLEEKLRDTQHEIAVTKDQTSSLQEQMDTELAVINARQNDAQRNSSSIRELLSGIQYELATVQATVQSAEQERKERYKEKDAETKALAQARDEVKALKAKDEELRTRLGELREKFKLTFKKNQDGVGPR
jgi:chromosome segregation ATPase